MARPNVSPPVGASPQQSPSSDQPLYVPSSKSANGTSVGTASGGAVVGVAAAAFGVDTAGKGSAGAERVRPGRTATDPATGRTRRWATPAVPIGAGLPLIGVCAAT